MEFVSEYWGYTISDIIQVRRDSSSDWLVCNPTLAQGEIGFELDSTTFKIGDGINAWVDLPYWITQGGTGIQGDTGIQGYTGVRGIQNFTEFDTTQYPSFLPAELGWSQRDEALFLGVTGMQWIQLGVGFKSMLGNTGIQGITGFQGITGIGIQGGTGVAGITGIQGGGTGIQGLQGNTGIRGVTGFQGVTGLALGATGIAGVTGVYGASGTTGLQGVTGLALGATGIAGNTGLGSAIKSFCWSVANPVSGGIPGPRLKQTLSATRISAYTTAATNAIYNIYDRTAVGQTGTKLMVTDMTAVTTATEVTSSFNSTALPADSWLWLSITSVSGTPGNLVVSLDSTVV